VDLETVEVIVERNRGVTGSGPVPISCVLIKNPRQAKKIDFAGIILRLLKICMNVLEQLKKHNYNLASVSDIWICSFFPT